MDSVFITAVIDAEEGRDTATVDLPGAYLSADNPDLVHMIFRGKMAELMAMTDPSTYRKFVKCHAVCGIDEGFIWHDEVSLAFLPEALARSPKT